jgi:hypothetical protein
MLIGWSRYDQLNFIEGGDARGDATMAQFTRQLLEVAPSIRTSAFPAAAATQGVVPLSVAVTALTTDGQPIPAGTKDALRYAVWEEAPAAPAVFCAHLAVINRYVIRPVQH